MIGVAAIAHVLLRARETGNAKIVAQAEQSLRDLDEAEGS